MNPRIAIVPGDPSGIEPELIARLLTEEGVCEAADILLVGDAHLWQRGAAQAGLDLTLNTIAEEEVAAFGGLTHLDLQTIDPEDVRVAEVTVAGGTCAWRRMRGPGRRRDRGRGCTLRSAACHAGRAAVSTRHSTDAWKSGSGNVRCARVHRSIPQEIP